MKLEIKGLSKVNNMVSKLPQELEFNTIAEASNFLKNVRKRMLLRVPVDTGELKSGIGNVVKGKNYARITIQGKYLLQQEEGIGMPHYMPISLVKQKPHPRAKQAAGRLPPKRGMVIARRYTPFVIPSLDSEIHKLPQMLQKVTKKAIAGANR